jgi:hypothetical protein
MPTPIADGDNAAYLGIDALKTGSIQKSQWVKAAWAAVRFCGRVNRGFRFP